MTGFSLRAKIGATGTRHGATSKQYAALYMWFTKIIEATGDQCSNIEFHHGDCVGFDEEAFHCAKTCGMKTIAHPPSDPRFRAHTKSDIIKQPQGYMARNANIVHSVDMMIAGPQERYDSIIIGAKIAEPYGGTWRTAALALKFDKPVHFFFACGRHVPSGSIIWS